jgi:hypothetical protein
MIINSKFSSLYFGKKEEWKAFFDLDTCFIQRYAVGEEIRIQFIGFTDEFQAKYLDENGLSVSLNVVLLYKHDNRRLFEIVFSINSTGIYELTLSSDTDEAKALFCIDTIDNLRDDTILLNYTHRRNEYDTVFIDSNGAEKRFNFRAPGGVYPGDKTQALDNEIFRDQRFEAFQIAAESYEVSVLTIGTNKGVPQWVGNRINNIFKLSDILINNVEAKRNEGSVPELIKAGTDYPLYIFKLNIEMPDEERIYAPESFEFNNLIITNSGTPISANDESFILTNKV